LFNTPAQRLTGKLLHYSYEDFETVLRKLDAYSTAGARQRHGAGNGSSFGKALGRAAWLQQPQLARTGLLDQQVDQRTYGPSTARQLR